MASLPANDRRRSERHWTAVPVIIWNGDSKVEGVTINASDIGLYLFAAADLRVGAQIEVEFCPHRSKEKVRASGVVRRRALYLYGIEFVTTEHSGARAALPGEKSSRQSASGSA